MKKISIIVPCYGTEEYVEKCINSLFMQTYSNLEIIAVNDCSKGNMQEILERLASKDSRLKIIKNEVNKGLFQTRIVGSKNATGDFIAFLDSDDYVDTDFYRLLINNIEENDSDIVISNYVRKNKDKEYISGLTFNTNNATYDGKEFYDMFFEQTGRNIRFHLLWNKLIKADIWKKVIKDVSKVKDRIIMTEDLAFSAVALFYAKKVSFCDNAIYYYTVNDNQSTSIKNITVAKINNNIKDIQTVFNFIKHFLTKNNMFEKYKKQFEIWESFYISMHINTYKKLKKKNRKIEKLNFDYENDECIKSFYKIQEKDKSWDNYYGLETSFDESFNEIKANIINPDVKIISFDMFDTLVTRPFYMPSDMFSLLNNIFIQLFNPIKAVDFSKIRKKSEAELRNINYKKRIPEVTLDGIYEYISNTYNLDKKKLEKIKDKEKEMELHFCNRRNSGYELYSLARHLKKKTILTSDIYLPRDLIESILQKNGYEFDEIYLSSELLKTKSSGTLFEYIIDKEKTNKILHIGDNYESDYEIPKRYNIQSMQLIKASDVMMGYSRINVKNCGNLYKHFVLFNQDHIPYEEITGVRCSIGIISNKYFDNPFRPYNSYSDFNGDPYFIGYYALGMQIISLCKWLFDDARKNKIDSISFMARDGYLPYEAAKIYAKSIGNYDNIKLNYTYVSRKSLMPLLLKDKSGISLIDTYLNIDKFTPRELMNQFEKVIKISKQNENKIGEQYDLDKKISSIDEFNSCMSLIYDVCFDQEKYDKYYKLCKKYFDQEFYKNCSTFDIGYSGKPEAIISSIIEKPIRTYFIHANNSSAFNNMRNCNSELCTFYEYKPTLTGTIRELFISNIGPSCVGYEEKNGTIKPILKDTDEYSYYNKKMIESIQQGALDFVKDFCNYFKEYINDIDLNKYYMSIPLEYYYHYSFMEDRLPIKNLLFEDNVNNYVELNDFIFNRYKEYSKEYSLGIIPKKFDINEINYYLPKRRLNRILYYSMYDHKELKNKWNKWKLKKDIPEQLPKSKLKRTAYYIVFDREKFRKKLFKK